MNRGTQRSVALTVLLAVALLVFVGPAVTAQDGSDGSIGLEEEWETNNQSPGTIDIAVEPAEFETAPDNVSTYEVVVYGATNGISGYDNIEIVVEDPSVAQFVGFFETAENNQGNQGPLSESEIRDGSGNATDKGPVLFLRAALGEKVFPGANRTVIAEIETESLAGTGASTNVTISDQVDGFEPSIQNTDEDMQVADELRPSNLTVTNFSVDVLDTNTPVVGDDIQVDVAVENIGETQDTQQVTLSTGPDIGSNTTTVTLGANESTTRTLTVPTSSGDAGEYSVTVASDNSADSADLTVLEQPGFAVDVLEANDPLEGNSIDVEFTVENLDSVQDTQTMSLSTTPDIGGASTDLTLAGGETTVETLSVPTQVGEAGAYSVSVASNDDTSTANVSVLAEAEFLLNITQVKQGVVEGEPLTVDYDITNPGDVQATQDIDFAVDGTVEATETNVTVTAGATISRVFTYETTTGDAPSVEVSVSSADDTDTETAPVGEPAFFAVNITGVDTPVTEGETTTVDYEVTNTGDTQGIQTLTLTVDGTEEDNRTDVALDSGATVTGTFTYQTVDGDAPSVDLSVASEDDTATETVTVNEPPFFAVSVTGVDTPVTEGETATVDYEVTNVGDVTGTQDIAFSVNGTVEETDTNLTLQAGETTTGAFSYQTADGDAPALDVAVSSENDTATASVTVDEPPFFDAVIAFIDKEVTAGDQLTVAYTVANTGDVAGTQEVTLEINGTVVTTETIPLGAGETTSSQFVYNTSTDDVPAVETTVSSENTSDTETVLVNQPPFFAVTVTDATDEVVEGGTVTVDYEVTNTGGVEDTQDIVFEVNGTTETTETDLTLAGSETTTGSFSYQTGAEDTPGIEVAVASADDTATETVTVNEPALFAVTVTGLDSSVIEGETVTVNYTVTNTGGVADTQDIGFTVNGTTEKTESNLTLQAGEAFDGAFDYQTVDGDAPALSVAVASENDTATGSVTVDEPPFFAVTVTGVDTPVTEGETTTVDYEVTNVGDVTGTQDIVFEVNGTTETTETDLTLAGNETFTGSFSYETVDGDAPGVEVAVASADDTATETVGVEEPALFAVTITSIDQDVPEGAEVGLDYTVENTGGAEATQDITFTVDGTVVDTATNVTLDGGETFSDTFVYATEQGDAPEITVAVASEDDTVTENVTVNENAIFAVTVTGFDTEVTAGETVTVGYEVTNTGDIEDTQTVTVEVDGTVENTTTVTLGGNETFGGSFDYGTDGSDVPAVSVAISSEDDTAERTVTVNEPAFLAVTVTSIDAEVVAGETVTVGYEVTNTGDVKDTQTVTVGVDGTVENTTTVTLGGNETFAGGFEYSTGTADTPSVDVSVSSEDETVTETVVVLDPASSGLTGLVIAGQGSDATLPVGETGNVTVTVTNTGDEAGAFDVTLGIGSAVDETVTTTQLDGGATETVTFTGVTGGLAIGEYTVTVGTDDDSISGSLAVVEPAVSALADLEVASQGGSAIIAGGESADVSATLANTGGQTDIFDVSLLVEADNGTTVVAETTTVELGSGSNTTVTFANVTGDLETTLPRYNVTVAAGDAAVDGELAVWPDVNGDGNPANDTTGDGLLNDVDSDGEFTIFDVQELFLNFESQVVQDTPAAFSFNDDSIDPVTIFDVQSLFVEFNQRP